MNWLNDELVFSRSRRMASALAWLASHFLKGSICSTLDESGVSARSAERRDKQTNVMENHLAELWRELLPISIELADHDAKVFFKGDGNGYELINVGEEVCCGEGRDEGGPVMLCEGAERLCVVLVQRSQRKI
jgi:hypothetical protein